jgi:Glyoxalase-like domain
VQTLRLRQAVVAAADRDGVVATWARELGTGAPFHDPGVEVFGLGNAVVPVGDAFLEVVTPLVPGDGCPAERHMTRQGGDCGYMAIFQVADMDRTRAHLRRLGLRSVLDLDLDDIRGTHVHPADLGGAIVSFDRPVPESSWRWGGPAWESEPRSGRVTGLAGIRLVAEDPAPLVASWSAALAVAPAGSTLRLGDGSYVCVGEATGETRPRLAGIDLWAADGVEERSFDLAGVTFRLVRDTRPRAAA